MINFVTEALWNVMRREVSYKFQINSLPTTNLSNIFRFIIGEERTAILILVPVENIMITFYAPMTTIKIKQLFRIGADRQVTGETNNKFVFSLPVV